MSLARGSCSACGDSKEECGGECHWLDHSEVCASIEHHDLPDFYVLTSDGMAASRHPEVFGAYYIHSYSEDGEVVYKKYEEDLNEDDLYLYLTESGWFVCTSTDVEDGSRDARCILTTTPLSKIQGSNDSVADDSGALELTEDSVWSFSVLKHQQRGGITWVQSADIKTLVNEGIIQIFLRKIFDLTKSFSRSCCYHRLSN